MSYRVGILSGTFDPIHKGHVSFALQAIEAANLDLVLFVPEPLPRHKKDVTHVSHRIAMIKLAIKAYPNMGVLELPDKKFTVANSLPRIVQAYPDAKLLLLIGTDVLGHISVWPHMKQMFKTVGLVVAVRGDKDERQAFNTLSLLPGEPTESHVLLSNFKFIAARDIRAKLKKGETVEGVLDSTAQYAQKHWIYTSLPDSARRS